MTRPQPAIESATAKPKETPPGELRTGTLSARFDPPHALRTADAAADDAVGAMRLADAVAADIEPASVCAPIEVAPDELREELHRQAGELSAHLRREASDVDRRESQMHARLGALEQQLRAAELAAKEYRAELERRCAELDQRERALEERADYLAGAERYLDANRCESGPRDRPNAEAAWSALRDGQQRLEQAQRRLNGRAQTFEQQRIQVIAHLRGMYERLAAERDEAARRSLAIKRDLARRATELERKWSALQSLEAKLLAKQNALGGADRRGAV